MDETITVGIKTKEPFHESTFEKRLLQLKDTQDSIQALSNWCVHNRVYVDKIIQVWCKVVKKVKVELRLTLFYLANDVLQYCRKKNLTEFVEGWMWALKESTPFVRDEKVKKRIQRIFKIWDEREVYSDVFVLELLTLLDDVPKIDSTDSSKAPLEFDPNIMIEKIKKCKVLEDETDLCQRKLNEAHFKITDVEALRSNLKDRKKTDDFLPELDDSVRRMEAYVAALDHEALERVTLISLLEQSELYYDTQRGEAKVVATAYKNFGHRVKSLKKKLDELLTTLSSSPVVSPDLNAPSPPPDYEIETFMSRPEVNNASLFGAVGNTKTDLDSRLSMLFNGSFSTTGIASGAVNPLPVAPTASEVLASAQANMAELLRTLSASLVQQVTTPGVGLPYSLLVPPPPPPPLPFPEAIPPPPPTTAGAPHNWPPPPPAPAVPPSCLPSSVAPSDPLPWNKSVNEHFPGYISFEDSETSGMVKAGNLRTETSVDHRNLISLTGNQSPASKQPTLRQMNTAKNPSSSHSNSQTSLTPVGAAKITDVKSHYQDQKPPGGDLSTSNKRKWDGSKSGQEEPPHYGNNAHQRREERRRSTSSPQSNGHNATLSTDRTKAPVTCLNDKLDKEWASRSNEPVGKKPNLVEKKTVPSSSSSRGSALQSVVVPRPGNSLSSAPQRSHDATPESRATSSSHQSRQVIDLEAEPPSRERRLSHSSNHSSSRRSEHSSNPGQQWSRSRPSWNGARGHAFDGGRSSSHSKGRSREGRRSGGPW